MATERQINANRANAQKSSGPRTEAGCAKVSRNALRHGLLARTLVLPDESRHRFVALLTELEEEFLPVTSTEHWLVDKMATAKWRQLRCWGFEKEGLVHETCQQTEPPPSTLPDASQPARRAANAFRSLADTSNALPLMIRYESRFDRQYHNALNQLARLRQQREIAKQTQLSTEESIT
jgi:hypothetical protein